MTLFAVSAIFFISWLFVSRRNYFYCLEHREHRLSLAHLVSFCQWNWYVCSFFVLAALLIGSLFLYRIFLPFFLQKLAVVHGSHCDKCISPLRTPSTCSNNMYLFSAAFVLFIMQLKLFCFYCAEWWVRLQRSWNAIVPGIIRNGLVTSHNRCCWSPCSHIHIILQMPVFGERRAQQRHRQALPAMGKIILILPHDATKRKEKKRKSCAKETKNVEIINCSVWAHNRRNYPFPASLSAHFYHFSSVGFLHRFVVIAETMQFQLKWVNNGFSGM